MTLRTRRFLAAAGVIMIAGFSLWRLLASTFSEDIMDMLPLSDAVIGRQHAFLSAIKATGTVVVELEKVRPDDDFAALARAGRTVAGVIGGSGLFSDRATPSAEDFLALRQLLAERWPALFSEQDSAWLVRRLDADSLEMRLRRTLANLFVLSDQSAGTFSLKHDPFDFSPVVLSRLAVFSPSPDIRFEDGFITTEARDRILLVVAARQSGLDAAGAGAVCAVMARAQQAAAENGAAMTWMGAQRAARDNSKTVRRDVNLTVPVTAGLILLICALVYGRFIYGLAVFLPTLLGIAAALAVVSFGGKLAVITLGFGAALIGITVDYAIHFFFHVDRHPDDCAPARTIGRAVIASALTTAAAFAVLLFARIPGLSQLGMVTALGICLVAAFTLLLLPQLFPPAGRGAVKNPAWDLCRMMQALYAKEIHRHAAIPLIAISAAAGLGITRLTFDGNPDTLNGMTQQTRAAEKQIETHWRGVTGGTYLVVEDGSEDGVKARAERFLAPCLDTLIVMDIVNPASACTGVLPSTETQERNMRRWRRVWTAERVALVKTAFDRVCPAFGLPPERLYPYAAGLAQQPEMVEVSAFPDAFVSGVLANFLFASGGRWYCAVPVVKKTGAAWDDIARIAADNGVLAVNSATLGRRLVAIVRTEFSRIAVSIPVVVLLILLATFRSVRLALLAFFPPVLSALLTLGIMGLCGMTVNIVSFMVLAFIFGLGIDYSIYLVAALSGEKHNAGTAAAGQAAASVSVAALTTLAGLGVSLFNRHPVLLILGRTGTLGILSSWLLAVVVVPYLFGTAGTAEKKKAGDKTASRPSHP